MSSCWQKEPYKVSWITFANTGSDPWTVMIVNLDADSTCVTVESTRWPQNLTSIAKWKLVVAIFLMSILTNIPKLVNMVISGCIVFDFQRVHGWIKFISCLIPDKMIDVRVRLDGLSIWNRAIVDNTWYDARITHRTSIKTLQTHIHPNENNDCNDNFDRHL